MKITCLDRLRGYVVWSKTTKPGIKGPQPRIITIQQAEAIQAISAGHAEDSKSETDADT